MIIALVDDNESERNRQIQLLLQGFKDFNIPVVRFDMFPDGESFLKNWKLGCYDLIVLDILMGNGLSGIDVAREIRKHNHDVRIVFCSTSNEYAGESYDVNASYYLQKPVTEKGIHDMISRLNIADFELRRFIVMPDGQKLVLRSILYTEYFNHQITIYQKNNTQMKLWISQKQFEELLAPYPFLISCTRGVVVNLHEVTRLDNDAFFMSNGSSVFISRRKKGQVEEMYREFLFHSLRKEMGEQSG